MNRNNIVISLKASCLQVKRFKEMKLVNFQQRHISPISLQDMVGMKMLCKTKCLKILCYKKILSTKPNNVL